MAFGNCSKKGHGFVFLHHAIAGWPADPNTLRLLVGGFSICPRNYGASFVRIQAIAMASPIQCGWWMIIRSPRVCRSLLRLPMNYIYTKFLNGMCNRCW